MAWIGRLIGVLVLIIAVIGVSLFFLPQDRIAKIASDQIASLTGRKVSISGDTSLSFYPILGVTTGPVSVANADWGADRPMFQATGLNIGVELAALFEGEVRISKLHASSPKLFLEQAADGRANWAIGNGADGAEPSDQQLLTSLNDMSITNGSVTYTDHKSGQTTQFNNTDLVLNWPDYRGAADIKLTTRITGAPVTIQSRVAQLASMLAGGVSPLKATVSAAGGTLRFDGRAGIQPQFSGTLNADISDSAAFSRAIWSAVDIPLGLGQTASLVGQVSMAKDKRIALRGITATLDQNRLTGDADITLGDTPYVNAQIKAEDLDLSSLTTNGGSSNNAGWSKAPIDASALSVANGEISLIADSIDLGDLKFQTTRVLTTIDRSRAVFDIRELSGYDGVIAGEFVANNRNGLSVGGDLVANGVELQKFLSDFMNITRLSGTGNVTLKFLGVGNSQHAIMNSLIGDMAVSAGPGVIHGFNLGSLLQNGTSTGDTTVFDTLAAPFDIKDGVMSGQALSLTLGGIKATGEGQIGLGGQNINYLITATAMNMNGGKGIAIPVRIKGPWSSPKISADLSKAIDLNLSKEKARLKEQAKAKEAKVKQKIKDKISKELNVDLDNGKTVEDNLKQKVEDAAKNKLLDLLGR